MNATSASFFLPRDCRCLRCYRKHYDRLDREIEKEVKGLRKKQPGLAPNAIDRRVVSSATWTSTLTSVNQKDSVEINLLIRMQTNLIGEVEKEEDSFECLINEVSSQNIRNHSLKTREKTLAEWREYKEESCVVRKIIKDLGGPFQYRAIKEAHFRQS